MKAMWLQHSEDPSLKVMAIRTFWGSLFSNPKVATKLETIYYETCIKVLLSVTSLSKEQPA